MNHDLVIRSVLLGIGLAMDAFSVSLADGLAEPDMKKKRMLEIAGAFAVFQFAMPVIGWTAVHKAVSVFGELEKFIPWIALLLLLYIGGKMLIEGIMETRRCGVGSVVNTGGSETDDVICEGGKPKLSFYDLIVQGVATSIDALSVGFTIERYGSAEAFTASGIIGVITLVICLAGLYIGRKIGTRLSGRAEIFGGLILILIGVEIWVKGIIP